MGTTKKRGGAKVHRKRVQKRNQELNAMRSAYQKLFDESMKAQIEELKKQYESGNTETLEVSGV